MSAEVCARWLLRISLECARFVRLNVSRAFPPGEKPMHSPFIAAAVKWQAIVAFVAILLFVGGVCWLSWKHDPFRRLARFRVKRPRHVRFESLGITMVGKTPTNYTVYRYGLAYAMDDDWVYFRRKSIPFMPKYALI
jgi:hypothetical protein